MPTVGDLVRVIVLAAGIGLAIRAITQDSAVLGLVAGLMLAAVVFGGRS